MNGTHRGFLTDLACWIIDTPMLFKLLKELARLSIKNGVIKRGIDWDGMVRRHQARLPELERIQAELNNAVLTMPDYYRVPFHAYDEGNLSWLAAFEYEAANMAIATRTFKLEPHLTPKEARDKMYRNVTDVYDAYRQAHPGVHEPESIVDFGCSVGVSTRWLAQTYPQAQVTGFDLSTYFLAVAEDCERVLAAAPMSRKRIQYKHLQLEDTGLAAASLDMVSIMYVVHECPAATTRAIVKEAKRLLKPGGVVLLVDSNPMAEDIRNLPPPIYMMRKSTEPHLDEYNALDLQEVLREAGFHSVWQRDTDPKHQAILGMA